MQNLQYQARVEPLLPLSGVFLAGVGVILPEMPRRPVRLQADWSTNPIVTSYRGETGVFPNPIPRRSLVQSDQVYPLFSPVVWGAESYHATPPTTARRVQPDSVVAPFVTTAYWGDGSFGTQPTVKLRQVPSDSLVVPFVTTAAPSYWGDGSLGSQPTNRPRQLQTDSLVTPFVSIATAPYWGDGSFGTQPIAKLRQIQPETFAPLLAIAAALPYWGDASYSSQPQSRPRGPAYLPDNAVPVVIAAISTGVWGLDPTYPVPIRKPRPADTQSILPLLPIVYVPFWGDSATYPIPSQVTRKGLSPSVLNGTFEPSCVLVVNLGIFYHIYWNHGLGGPVDFTAPIGTTNSLLFDAPPLFANADVTYLVRAYDSLTGYEEQNGDARVRIKLDGSGNDITSYPAPPIALTVKAKAGGTATIRWQYPPGIGTKAAGFKVYVNGVFNQSVSAVLGLPVDAYIALISGLSDGVTYTIGVSSFSASGESTLATVLVVGAGVGPTAITGFSATAIP